MQWIPYDYQVQALEHGFDHLYGGLLVDMGLGKTAVALTLVNRVVYEECEIEKVLVVAPKLVTRTVWKQEAAKWDHLKHLKVSIVWGTPAERVAALKVKADVYVINRENLVWLLAQYQSNWPFKMVILDELSSFKNHQSQRFKAMKLVRPYIDRLIGLTGTPAPNGLIDLWAPVYLMDQGDRLGKTITGFRERYFTPDKTDGGHIAYSYRIRPDAEKAIYEKISDICISMKAKDYLTLPPLIENDIVVELDSKIMVAYEQFEIDQIMLLLDKEVTALSAAALRTKLLQFANGAVYHEDKTWTEIHRTKLDALDEVIQDSQGKNVIVFYSFRHDLERIRANYPKARMLKTPRDVEDWNKGLIPLLVLHPASAGHGLNLQDGGHIMIWFGLNDSLELYLQAIARLMRQGQLHSVIMHRIIAKETRDMDVARSLTRKENGQNALMEALRASIIKYEKQGRLRLPAGFKGIP